MTPSIELILGSTPLFLTGVFVFGLLIGSFLNVVIFRLPARLEHEWKCQCSELLELDTADNAPTPPGIVRPRSSCGHCGHKITALENIPVISYLALRGRCSHCKAKISLRYPLIELSTAVLFLLVAFQFGPTAQCAAGLVLTAFLVTLTMIDVDHQLLPDSLTLMLLWVGLLFSLVNVFTDPVSSILGAAFGYISLWIVFQLFKLITGKEGMGYGDFKLLAALGAWLGWQMLPMTILFSTLVGAVLGSIMLVIKLKSRNQPIPFGPYLAMAGWIGMVWGSELLEAYLRFSGMTQ